ncbi:NEQ157 [Nanoarchaeum equitans Kin4-M]|uniref:NEQ157 n=1 Tax=Nanoarchaeum equitans (strain Kin4-M) TaxID=228908 RepID=Q74MN1_NANEQ|nr:NEQ157 [Nanoarchaeum equitans Kin4-M]
MDASKLLDKAFEKARIVSQAVYRQSKKKGLAKIKETEINRIKVVRDYLVSKLNKIVESFPRIKDMPIFYVELLDTYIGIKKYKGTLAKFKYSADFIDKLFQQYKNKIKGASNIEQIRNARKSFYGRVSSIIKELPFDELREIEKNLKEFPYIGNSIYNVVISGLPNVGKSTLLNILTNNKVKTANYPFTTKQILIGKIKTPFGDIAVIDTPGILDRPLDKINKIEKRAVLALRYLADDIIYIIDLTETSAPLKNQLNLLEQIKKEFGNPIIYFSKTDLFTDKEWALYKKLNIKGFTNPKELKEYLMNKAIEVMKKKAEQ